MHESRVVNELYAFYERQILSVILIYISFVCAYLPTEIHLHRYRYEIFLTIFNDVFIR